MENKKKLFLCHSSKDKERFVEKLAYKLNNKGIDVYYDDWVLDYGDSLIDLFDMIEEADVFVIVLSKYSVESKWVREELSAGFIRKIENGTKLIPIIIDDDIDIPSSLRHTHQCRISDINDYDEDFKKLCNTIYGISNKPNLGATPDYTSINPINGLSQIDSLIIKKLGEQGLKNNIHLSFESIMELLNNEFSKEDVNESIDVLEKLCYVKCRTVTSSRYPYYTKLTPFGIVSYCLNYESNGEEYIKNIASTLLNDNVHDNYDLHEKTEVPIFIINGFLNHLKNNRWIKGQSTMNGKFIIYDITGTGSRILKQLIE